MPQKIISALLTPFVFLGSWLYIQFYQINIPVKETLMPNVSAPAQAHAGKAEALAAGGGWYVTMDERFEGDTLPELWGTSPHGLRNKEYWCDNMVPRPSDGTVKILAAALEDNVCDVCPAQGEFASGIETRKMVDGKRVRTFEQAFGYYECRVKVPVNTGLWSAFWLQTDTQSRLGSNGKDGSEIDIFESAFYNDNPRLHGNAVHWDGYSGKFYRMADRVTDTGVDLYDGDWHTYGLLWTPENYTFFVDGTAVWQTNAGGVCRVPAYLRLTVEIRRGEYGPYGARMGDFTNTKENPAVFEIDYVKVWQHTDFLKSIKSPDDFREFKPPAYMDKYYK